MRCSGERLAEGAGGVVAVERRWVQPRPDLERRLDAALTHRLTTVVAADGYGKSTLLEGWITAVDGVFHRFTRRDRDITRLAHGLRAVCRLRVPDLPSDAAKPAGALGPKAHVDDTARASAMAGALAEALGTHCERDLVLGLDDLDVIADSPGAVRLIETLVRSAPRRLHILVTSRSPLPFPVDRLRRDDQVFDLDASDLSLTVAETECWCDARLGQAGRRLAPALHGASSGWPAAVHAAIDDLAGRDAASWSARAARAAVTSGTLEATTVAMLEDLPATSRRLLQAATVLPVLTDHLAEALDAPSGALAALASLGVFLEDGEQGHHLTPAGRTAILRHAPPRPSDAADVVGIGAAWYVEHGMHAEALRSARAVGDSDLILALLRDHGARFSRRPDELLAAVDALAPAERDLPEVLRLAGIAHHNRGDWDQARTLFARIADSPGFDAAVAYRVGFIDHLRGELDSALAAYRRGHEHGHPPVDATLCLAMAATVLWLRGDRDGCARLADDALEEATRLGDSRALAASHTVQALLAAAGGDRRANDAHYLRALEHAERAGDSVQQIRIRCNRASHHLEEGAYGEALAELDLASRLADVTGFTPFTALALSNRAEIFARLGRLDEAAVDATEAAQRWMALGSSLVGYGLVQLAHIQALRGDSAEAAANYRQAIARAEEVGEVQSLVPALAGLARLLSREDPEQARQLADRALAQRDSMGAVEAHVAAARVALSDDRRMDAHRLLQAAGVMATDRRDRPAAAELLELQAALDLDPRAADDAVARWSAVGDPVGLARAELLRARIGEAGAARQVVRQVRARLHAIGCRSLDTDVDEVLTTTAPDDDAPVAVDTLGAFRVRRQGRPVGRTEWQSRKARELLRMLVAARGRPVPREQLIAVLWPEDEGADPRVSKRLNVMVSTLRSVLDPERSYPSDHFVVTDGEGVGLDLAHVDVDVEGVIESASRAVRLEREGRHAEALEHWRTAEAGYGGDVYQDDPYADWALSLREQGRQAYVQAAAAVATAEAAAGHHDQSIRYWLRLLERDPYDERAHLGVVCSLDRAGRHGDARRRYDLYANRMRELALEPAPFPI